MTIAQHRKRLGLSQAALAKRLGVGQATVADWEKDKTRPNAAARSAMAAMFQIPETAPELNGLPADGADPLLARQHGLATLPADLLLEVMIGRIATCGTVQDAISELRGAISEIRQRG